MIDRAAATSEDPAITLTALMAAKFAALHFDQLSSDVVSRAKLCLVDFLASAFASRALPWSRQALSVAGQSSGSSTIVGSSCKCIEDVSIFFFLDRFLRFDLSTIYNVETTCFNF